MDSRQPPIWSSRKKTRISVDDSSPSDGRDVALEHSTGNRETEHSNGDRNATTIVHIAGNKEQATLAYIDGNANNNPEA